MSEMLMRVAMTGLVLGVVWWLTSPNPGRIFAKAKSGNALTRPAASISKDEVVEILKMTAEGLFEVFTELAQCAERALETLQQLGRNSLERELSSEQFESLLLQKEFKDRIAEVRTAVYIKFNTDAPTFQKRLADFSSDPEVEALSEGIDKMYENAMEGKLPICPGVDDDKQLSEGEVLGVLGMLHKTKEEKFTEIFSKIDSASHTVHHPVAGVLPSPELAEMLREGSKTSEDHVWATYPELEGDKQRYYHSMAVHSRDPLFKAKKEQLVMVHSKAVVDIMKPKQKKVSTIDDITDEPIGPPKEVKIEYVGEDADN